MGQLIAIFQFLRVDKGQYCPVLQFSGSPTTVIVVKTEHDNTAVTFFESVRKVVRLPYITTITNKDFYL